MSRKEDDIADHFRRRSSNTKQPTFALYRKMLRALEALERRPKRYGTGYRLGGSSSPSRSSGQSRSSREKHQPSGIRTIVVLGGMYGRYSTTDTVLRED
jgi:hypothetical protein